MTTAGRVAASDVILDSIPRLIHIVQILRCYRRICKAAGDAIAGRPWIGLTARGEQRPGKERGIFCSAGRGLLDWQQCRGKSGPAWRAVDAAHRSRGNLAGSIPSAEPPPHSCMPTSIADFSKAAEETGILSAEVLVEHAGDAAPDTDATNLANRLVKAGRLTAFQARYIYGGKARSLLLGPYVVLDVLGKGGMGYVYKAQHRKMRRVVALKVISKSALNSPDAVRRFEREVQAAARLEHPNIVTAFDAGEAAGTHYLVMQYVDGKNLADAVHKLGPQPVGRVIDWILQAAHGLEYAHEQGVIHRDIKPENLLVDSHGAVKILDMGLARLDTLDGDQDQLTHTGQIMGTVDYMAPEQALDTRQADTRSDIYSLGVTLWYLLSGRPLFDGDSTVKKIMAHQQKPPPSLSTAGPAIDARLDAVFQRMVAKDPASRFQSMRELIGALVEIRQHAIEPSTPADAHSRSCAPTRGGADETIDFNASRSTPVGESAAASPLIELTVSRPVAPRPNPPAGDAKRLQSPHTAGHVVALGVGLATLCLLALVAVRFVGRRDSAFSSAGSSRDRPPSRREPRPEPEDGDERRPAADRPAVSTRSPSTGVDVTPGRIILSGVGDSPTLGGRMPKNWERESVFARIRGLGEATFDSLPTSAYVLDIDVEVHDPRGRACLRLGESDAGVELSLGAVWPQDFEQTRVPARLFSIQPWGINWEGGTHFAADERLRLRLVVLDDEKVLLRDDRLVLHVSGAVTDFRLKLTATPESDVTIYRLACRAPTAEDVRDSGLVMPQRMPECDPRAAAGRVTAWMTEMIDRQPASGRPFVLESGRMAFRWIEPAELTLGDPREKFPQLGAGRERVRISRGYWLGAHEVTQAQWASIMKSDPSTITGSPYLPVNNVSWSDASGFCERMSALERADGRLPEGYEYRLPTEAEWEWASRAGTDRKVTIPDAERPIRDRYRALVEIGATPANPWGFHEMLGNVAEWCLDSWQDYSGDEANPVVDRVGGGKNRSPPFVVRGGGVWRDDSLPTCFARTRRHDVRSGFRGFRVALAPVAATLGSP